jgi:hypothetical protein
MNAPSVAERMSHTGRANGDEWKKSSLGRTNEDEAPWDVGEKEDESPVL